MVFIIFLGIFIFFVILLLSKSVYMVNQAETVVIERLGKFNRVLLPGLHIIVPFVDTPHTCIWSYIKPNEYGKYIRTFTRVVHIDLREAVHEFPKQNVITRDNVNIEINALLYYQITDPRAALYEVVNLPEAIEKLTQTTLRNVIGSMDLDETLVSRDSINDKLQHILDDATNKWGVKVNRVELQEVNPPRDIQIAMEKQMRAERDRRAIILESEGEKQAAILKAEGEFESAILRARGKADAQVIEATAEASARYTITEAEAKSLELLQKVNPNANPMPYLIAREYMKMLPEITKDKNGKVILVPYEATALMGSLATIKTLFQESENITK